MTTTSVDKPLAAAAIAYVLVAFLASGCISSQPTSQSGIRNEVNPSTMASTFFISSPAFADNTKLPAKFSCDGAGESPPLAFTNVPMNAKSLALILEDPDAPMGTFTHWLVWNIPTSGPVLENATPQGAVQGMNSADIVGFIGACPPSGTHRYVFRAYALDSDVSLPAGASRGELEAAIRSHVLAQAQMVGLYSRSKP